MDEPALHCRYHRLSAVVHIQAHENDADVTLNSGLGDAEIDRNLLVALALDDEIENFTLANAGVGVGDARIEGARDRLGQKAAAEMNAAQGADQRQSAVSGRR